MSNQKLHNLLYAQGYDVPVEVIGQMHSYARRQVEDFCLGKGRLAKLRKLPYWLEYGFGEKFLKPAPPEAPSLKTVWKLSEALAPEARVGLPRPVKAERVCASPYFRSHRRK